MDKNNRISLDFSLLTLSWVRDRIGLRTAVILFDRDERNFAHRGIWMDDRAEIADDRLVELTANIVTAFVSTQLVSIETLPKLIHDVHGALIGVMSCVK